MSYQKQVAVLLGGILPTSETTSSTQQLMSTTQAQSGYVSLQAITSGSKICWLCSAPSIRIDTGKSISAPLS